MNDTIFAVSGPGISRTLFHLIFFNNALKYIISPPFQRSRNGFESWNDLPKVMEWVNGEFGMAWWPWSPHPLTLAMAGYSLLKHLMQDCEILEEWELQRRMVGHNKDNKVWIGEYRESRTVEGGRQRQDPTGWVWGVCVEGGEDWGLPALGIPRSPLLPTPGSAKVRPCSLVEKLRGLLPHSLLFPVSFLFQPDSHPILLEW